MKISQCTAAAAALLAGFPTGSLAAALRPRRSHGHGSREGFEIAVLGGKTIRAQQVYNTAYQAQPGRGPRALAKAHSKYGSSLSPELLAVLIELLESLGVDPATVLGGSSGSGSGSGPSGSNTTITNTTTSSTTTTRPNTGSVSAVPQLFDSEYLAAVSIGSPPQTLMLDFDTGSSDLWVFSTETASSQQGGQTLYDPGASTSALTLVDAAWAIQYGDGSSASGNVFLDTVTIGGVTVTGQAVEAARNVSGSFSSNAASSGLLGLAFDGLNTVTPTKQKTFFSRAQDELAMPLFTANLKRGEAGNYNFGFVDPTEYNGTLSFVDVNTTTGFWQFEAAGYAVGNATANNNNNLTAFPHQAIVDTGTTLLLLPPAIVDAYYQQVPSAVDSAQLGGYVFDCDAALPDLSLALSDAYTAVVPGALLNYAPADGLAASTDTTCYGGVQADTGLSFAIYGDIFLKSQFVVFHGGDAQLGFAPKGV